MKTGGCLNFIQHTFQVQSPKDLYLNNPVQTKSSAGKNDPPVPPELRSSSTPCGWGVKNVAMMQKNSRSLHYPVRDLMLVENERLRENGRAVRYAILRGISRPYGTFRVSAVAFFYQHFVPDGTLTPPLFKFLNVFLKNKTRIFYTPPLKYKIYKQTNK